MCRCSLLHDGKTLIAGSLGNRIYCFDVATGKVVSTDTVEMPQVEHRAVWVLDLNKDDRMVALATFDQDLRLWDRTAHREARRIHLPFYSNHAQFSPDGKLLAVAANGIELYDVQAAKDPIKVPDAVGFLTPAAFMPGKTAIVVSCGKFDPTKELTDMRRADYPIRLWDYARREVPLWESGPLPLLLGALLHRRVMAVLSPASARARTTIVNQRAVPRKSGKLLKELFMGMKRARPT